MKLDCNNVPYWVNMQEWDDALEWESTEWEALEWENTTEWSDLYVYPD